MADYVVIAIQDANDSQLAEFAVRAANLDPRLDYDKVHKSVTRLCSVPTDSGCHPYFVISDAGVIGAFIIQQLPHLVYEHSTAALICSRTGLFPGRDLGLAPFILTWCRDWAHARSMSSVELHGRWSSLYAESGFNVVGEHMHLQVRSRGEVG